MTNSPFFRPISTKVFDTSPALLTNSFFNASQLKPRIQMLINPETKRRALWRYVLVTPVAALLLMCSQKDPASTDTPVGNRIGTGPVITTRPAYTGEVFTVVEQNPQPQGGIENLHNYLSQNLHYPLAAQKANVEGKVFVTFVIMDNGHITNVQILKGIGFGCDAEAVRVVSQMPPWIPGRQNGKAVNVKFNLPIAFALN